MGCEFCHRLARDERILDGLRRGLTITGTNWDRMKQMERRMEADLALIKAHHRREQEALKITCYPHAVEQEVLDHLIGESRTANSES
jgi:hypothetical protein